MIVSLATAFEAYHANVTRFSCVSRAPNAAMPPTNTTIHPQRHSVAATKSP